MCKQSNGGIIIKPRQVFMTIIVCVYPCVCVCVSVCVNTISQRIFNQSTSFLVEALVLTPGWSDSILRKKMQMPRGKGGPVGGGGGGGAFYQKIKISEKNLMAKKKKTL